VKKILFHSLICIALYNCNQKTMENQTNRLINSTSPYLLQHANNPVDWYPWGEEALRKAQLENKPILLSIGYSSCHWCHVMAHESFENDTIAAYMNDHFINIKLDREERPDIDNIYMDAVQAMGLRGGWPLNVFLTPEQKPFYGGTYFPKDNWLALLQNITKAYQENYEKLHESADQFANALQSSDALKYQLKENTVKITEDDIQQSVDSLEQKFDRQWGGMNRSPKFPMPSLWQYLLLMSDRFNDTTVKNHVLYTLDKIAQGGIYDQVGGGFSRYSVDGEWHVPHFEKMLYDNGQLLSLYANAYRISGKEMYHQVLIETAQWLDREMMQEQGGFYAALDADSEGVEGKYYVWSYDEVQEIATEETPLISRYYDITKSGNWEGTNVLRKLDKDEVFADNWKLSPSQLADKVNEFKKRALLERNNRIPPGLDNKIISGWNGLALTGLLDAYQATQNPLFARLAQTNAKFIADSLIHKNKLMRIYGQNTQGFLEDYAAVIEAFITYYETFFDETFLQRAQNLAEQAINEFYDPDEQLFFYTSDQSENLIARKKELFDNVIPASNSIMAQNLYKLGIMLDRDDFKETAQSMLNQVSSLVKQEPEYMSNWAKVTLMAMKPTPEILIVGDTLESMISEIQSKYLPNKVIMAGPEGTQLPLFEHKVAIGNQTTIYVCYDKTCQQPVFNTREAMAQIAKQD
jgi:uncharacterized protein YyaL (SSP411 family)